MYRGYREEVREVNQGFKGSRYEVKGRVGVAKAVKSHAYPGDLSV